VKNLPPGADLVAIPGMPSPSSFGAAFEHDLDAWLLSHPPPTGPAAKGEIGRLLIDGFLRHLAQQLDALHRACHSPQLDKLVTNLDESSHSRDRPISDREFERRQELLSLIVFYKGTHELLGKYRRQVTAGELPTTAQMNEIRAAVQVLLGPLRRSEKWLATRIGGQESQKKQFGSPEEKLHRRGEFRRMVKNCMAANPGESYSWATKQVAAENEVSESWVRTLAPKRSLK
jgi:hypothetical protein